MGTRIPDLQTDRQQAKDQLDWHVLTKTHADGKIERRTLNGLLLHTNHSGAGMDLLLVFSMRCRRRMWP